MCQPFGLIIGAWHDSGKAPRLERHMEYEVLRAGGTADEWRVEAANEAADGLVYVALFSGPEAEQRAREYADWKNTGDGAKETGGEA